MNDPKQIVAAGYDLITERYLAWSGGAPSPVRLHYLARLHELLHAGDDVLELGCGAGLPVTAALAAHCRVTAVDISAAQIALARQHVPGATFVQADMAALDVAHGTFDAVVAFYALIHLPRHEQGPLLKRIGGWLRPGGLLLATMGAHDMPASTEQDWLGAPMYWSSFDAATNRTLVRAAGLELLEAEVVTEDEDGSPTSFLWVIARI